MADEDLCSFSLPPPLLGLAPGWRIRGPVLSRPAGQSPWPLTHHYTPWRPWEDSDIPGVFLGRAQLQGKATQGRGWKPHPTPPRPSGRHKEEGTQSQAVNALPRGALCSWAMAGQQHWDLPLTLSWAPLLGWPFLLLPTNPDPQAWCCSGIPRGLFPGAPSGLAAPPSPGRSFPSHQSNHRLACPH